MKLLVFWYYDSFLQLSNFMVGGVVRDTKLTLACCYVWLLQLKKNIPALSARSAVGTPQSAPLKPGAHWHRPSRIRSPLTQLPPAARLKLKLFKFYVYH